MVNSFMPNSYLKTRSGKILYGGNKGISVFTPYEHCLIILVELEQWWQM